VLIRGPFTRGLVTAWAIAEDNDLVAVVHTDAAPQLVEPALGDALRVACALADEMAEPHWREQPGMLLVDVHIEPLADDQARFLGRPIGTLPLTLEDLKDASEGLVRELLGVLHATRLVPTGEGFVAIAREPFGDREHVWLQYDDADVALHLDVPAGWPLPSGEQLLEMRPEFAAADAVEQLSEIQLHCERGQPLFAFRAFYYHRLLARFDDPAIAAKLSEREITPEVTMAYGRVLLEYLMREFEYDLAEWVATATAELADTYGYLETSAEAWSRAAGCHEVVCDAEAAGACYARALRAERSMPGEPSRPATRMSAGITVVMLLAHVDLEDLDPQPSGELSLVLDEAERHLRAAQAGYLRLNDEKARWSLCAIQLDLIRVQDLRGDYSGALARLDELVGSDAWVEDAALSATEMHYRLAILAKQARRGPGGWEGYRKALYAAVMRHGLGESLPAARRVPYLVLLGQEREARDEPQSAFVLYFTAARIQLALLRHPLRPARPGVRRGGFLAIDAVTRAVRAQAMAALDGTDPEGSATQALLLTDHMKGRHFKRDLAFQLAEIPKSTSLGSRHFVDIRESLLGGRFDPRIMIADYAYLLRSHGATDEEIRELRQESMVDDDALVSFLGALPAGAKVLSFHAGKYESFVHIIDATHESVYPVRLPIALSQLDRAVSSLQAYFSGRGIYAPIDPRQPERHDSKMLAPLNQVRQVLNDVVEPIGDAELLVVVPHSTWHNLPIHWLLLPPSWERGASPGLVYAPSIELLALLQRRANSRWAPMARAVLTTVPTSRDPSEPFESAHAALCEALESGGIKTRATLLNESRNASIFDMPPARLHHILAHGVFRAGDEAMDSGLVLAAPPTERERLLTARDVLALRVNARHLTVQACSLGSSVPSDGDEFWGFSRAALAGGADSVLTPLWNIDLESSTALVSSFYQAWLVDGRPKWRAWADAQRAMATNTDHRAWRHPYHWAAFQLIGVWEE
jgi:hypothetical protein